MYYFVIDTHTRLHHHLLLLLFFLFVFNKPQRCLRSNLHLPCVGLCQQINIRRGWGVTVRVAVVLREVLISCLKQRFTSSHVVFPPHPPHPRRRQQHRWAAAASLRFRSGGQLRGAETQVPPAELKHTDGEDSSDGSDSSLLFQEQTQVIVFFVVVVVCFLFVRRRDVLSASSAISKKSCGLDDLISREGKSVSTAEWRREGAHRRGEKKSHKSGTKWHDAQRGTVGNSLFFLLPFVFLHRKHLKKKLDSSFGRTSNIHPVSS